MSLRGKSGPSPLWNHSYSNCTKFLFFQRNSRKCKNLYKFYIPFCRTRFARWIYLLNSKVFVHAHLLRSSSCFWGIRRDSEENSNILKTFKADLCHLTRTSNVSCLLDSEAWVICKRHIALPIFNASRESGHSVDGARWSGWGMECWNLKNGWCSRWFWDTEQTWNR